DFKPISTLAAVQHVDFQRMINISAAVQLEKITALEATARIRPLVAEIIKEHPGYTAELGGEDKDTEESMQSLQVAFLFATFVIFSLLVVTFRSILQPLLILTSIPLGFIGVIYAMLLHNRP